MVLALRDADEILTALQAALEDAPEAERPGLARALEVAVGAAVTSEAELRVRWTRRQLAAAGYEGPADAVAAVKALRSAEPALGLRQAVAMAREAAARD
ncbi:hypothetical protein Sm713_22220 [Streptomyces sp. TS71-3]|nr:hypothetical protein Sm713_22220 [Streptomyces sp. TS71-3]